MKGRSGNPKGRPKGSRNRVSTIIDDLLEGNARAIGTKCIEMALAGDPTALRLAMERICPKPTSRAATVELPDLSDPAGLPAASAVIIQRVSAGELTPDQGADLARLLEQHRRCLETAELVERVAVLERRIVEGEAPRALPPIPHVNGAAATP